MKGFDSCEIGYPYVEGEGPQARVIPAWFAEPVAGVKQFRHVIVSSGLTTLFEGRIKTWKQPMGEVRGITLGGYFEALDDAPLTDDDDNTISTSASVFRDTLQIAGIDRYVMLGSDTQFQDPDVPHSRGEFCGENGAVTPGEMAQQLTREGNGWPWDLQVWGRTIWLRQRKPPATPLYSIPWDETVDIEPTDANEMRGAVRVAYTDTASGEERVTDWHVSTTFESTFGLYRAVQIEGGTMTELGAETLAASYLSQREVTQWAGTITRETGRGLELDGGGERARHLVWAGEWVQIEGGPMLWIAGTEYTSESDRLSIRVGAEVGVGPDLFRYLGETVEAVRSGRNAVSGAKR